MKPSYGNNLALFVLIAGRKLHILIYQSLSWKGMLVRILHLATNKELEERGHLPHEYRAKMIGSKMYSLNQIGEIRENSIVFGNIIDKNPPNPKRARILMGMYMCEILA